MDFEKNMNEKKKIMKIKLAKMKMDWKNGNIC